MQWWAKYDKVYCLKIVDTFCTHLIQIHLDFCFFLLGVCLEIRLKTLRNLPFELVCALRYLAFILKLRLCLHSIKDVFIRLFSVKRHNWFRLSRLLVFGSDVISITSCLYLNFPANDIDLLLCMRTSSTLNFFSIVIHRRVPSMEIIFKLNSLHHALNDQA